MIYVAVGLSAGTLVGMAIILSYVLGWANKTFHVEVDSRVEACINALPAANCGGCGYVGCSEYAEAVVAGEAPVNKCTVGGESVVVALADIMGVEVEESFPYFAIVHCAAYYDDRLGRHEYSGEQTCAAANLIADVQGCIYGCLGFGDCVRSCDYDAIHMIDGLATVDYEKCIGCGTCAKACPTNIITITPFKADQILAVTCSNKDFGKDVTSVCKVGCIGCKACTRASDIFKVENNLSAIDYDAYSPGDLENLIKVAGKCKRNRIEFVGKKSEKDPGKN